MTEAQEKQFFEDFAAIIKGIEKVNIRMESLEQQVFHTDQLLGELLIQFPELLQEKIEERRKNDY